jgi:multisubunit Na+/H+ antiporter MnhB subunit
MLNTPSSPRLSPRRSTNSALATSPTQIQSAYAGRKEFSTVGNVNFRILAFAGGVSVILTSSLSIAICIAHWGILEMMIYIYTLLFGVLICVLEGQFIKNETVNIIRSGAIEGLPVLKYLWGRGVLYMLSGSLQLSHFSSMNVLSGAYLIGVGFLFVTIGMHTRRRLKKLKKSLKDVKVLKRQFNRFDRDGDGVLDMDEFGAFVANLTGDDMDEDELEGTFGAIDSQGKGYVTLEELQAWMKGFNEETGIEDTGGTGNTFQLM